MNQSRSRRQAIDGVGEMGFGEKRWGRDLRPQAVFPIIA